MKLSADDPVLVKSEMGAARLFELRAKYDIPAHIDLIPVRDDMIQIHRPRYCASYAYPF